jgi:Holliday junction resolvase RusA-like endonuclease
MARKKSVAPWDVGLAEPLELGFELTPPQAPKPTWPLPTAPTDARIIACRIVGVPEPKGSTRGFVYEMKDDAGNPVVDPKTGKTKHRAVVAPDNKRSERWQRAVKAAALVAANGRFFKKDVAVRIVVTFYVEKPKSVDRAQPTVPPDLDKYLRSTLDGLKRAVYADDSQVCVIAASKEYCRYPAPPGAWITIEAVA